MIGFDTKYMILALSEAKKALTQNEIPIAAVIVDENGELLSSAYNQVETLKDTSAHAEMLAIKKASALHGSKFLYKCDIYITLEPCIMCLAAICLARIGRIFYAASNDKYGAFTSNIKLFSYPQSYHQPLVYSNIMEKESLELLQSFFKDL